MKKIIVLFVAVSLAALLFFLLPASREKQIHARLDQLCQFAEKKPHEQPLESMNRAARISGLLGDPCRISLQNPFLERTFSRRDMARQIAMFRNRYTTLTLALHDISMTFPSDSQAQLSLTMRIKGTWAGNEPFADVRELAMSMEHIDGQWLINGIEEIQVLEQ